jgi:hypothetical protein
MQAEGSLGVIIDASLQPSTAEEHDGSDSDSSDSFDASSDVSHDADVRVDLSYRVFSNTYIESS